MYYLRNYLIKTCIALFIIVSTAQNVLADDNNTEQYTPSAEAMMYDGLIVRPISLASTIVGTGIFVVTLPFTLFSDSVEQAGEKLVSEPAAYTFKRCLGCLNEKRHR